MKFNNIKGRSKMKIGTKEFLKKVNSKLEDTGIRIKETADVRCFEMVCDNCFVEERRLRPSPLLRGHIQDCALSCYGLDVKFDNMGFEFWVVD